MLKPNRHCRRPLVRNSSKRSRAAQIKAGLSVNRELIELYRNIGRMIVARQEEEGWGAAITERLAADLQAEFPGIAGVSRSNLFRRRAFYLAYTIELTNVPVAVGQFDCGNMPRVLAEIPWYHNVAIFEKVKADSERLWYAEQTIQHGWSRAVLVHQIESDL